MDVLNIIGRKYPLFSEDLAHYADELTSLAQDNSFLVIGGVAQLDRQFQRNYSPEALGHYISLILMKII